MRGGLRLGVLMVAGAALTDCGPSASDDAPGNLSSVGSTPSGLNGADTTGDRTDSLRTENGTADGDARVDRMGTGTGSASDGGATEGGTRTPDAAAPAGR